MGVRIEHINFQETQTFTLSQLSLPYSGVPVKVQSLIPQSQVESEELSGDTNSTGPQTTL